MIESLPSDALGLPRVTSPDDAEDRLLVEATRGGSDDAFCALVDCHQQPIHRFCFHYLRNAEDAVEATQDTFVSAHRTLHCYRSRARFSTWLFQIALNKCRDRLRKRCPDPGFEQDAACPRPQPDQAAMYEANLAKLDRGLATLKEKDRAIRVLVGPGENLRFSVGSTSLLRFTRCESPFPPFSRAVSPRPRPGCFRNRGLAGDPRHHRQGQGRVS